MNQSDDDEIFILGSSFGQDSCATAVVAHEKHLPIHHAVYVEVMFDDNVSGEVPEHRDFIYEVAIPRFENDFGIHVDVIKSPVAFVERFLGVVGGNGYYSGKLRGFPLCGRCWVQRDCKAKALDTYWKSMPNKAVPVVGFTRDEDYRLFKKYGRKRVSYLYNYGITKQMVSDIVKPYGLLSPIYNFAPRNGCWFCPNSKWPEREHLYIYHNHLMQRLVDLSKTPNIIPKTFDRNLSMFDVSESCFWLQQQISFW